MHSLKTVRRNPNQTRLKAVGIVLIAVVLTLPVGVGSAFAVEGVQSTESVTGAKAGSKPGEFETSRKINKWLQPNKPGLLIRSLPDYNSSPLTVASFTRNDLVAPTIMYTVKGLQCGDGTPDWYGFTGFGDAYDSSGVIGGSNNVARQQCDVGDPDTGLTEFGTKPKTDAYKYPNFGYVAKKSGKFTQDTYYPTDANSLDVRAWYDSASGSWQETSQTYPLLVGGTVQKQGRGCRYEGDVVTQNFAEGGGQALANPTTCQCNTGLIDNQGELTDGDKWVDQWLTYSQAEPETERFTGNDRSKPYNQSGGKNGKVTPNMFDYISCWTTKVDQMVAVQNSLWLMRRQWWNGLIPQQPSGKRNPDSVGAMKYYYGWNEIPVSQNLDKTKNHKAWLIKLPAGKSNLNKLSSSIKKTLMADIQQTMNAYAGYNQFVPENKRLVLNSKKKSRVVIMVESHEKNDVWQREAMCQNVVFNEKKPKKLQIKFKASGKGNKGHCYLAGKLKADLEPMPDFLTAKQDYPQLPGVSITASDEANAAKLLQAGYAGIPNETWGPGIYVEVNGNRFTWQGSSLGGVWVPA